MRVFIDESGDCGMKSDGSPLNFTLAAVFFKCESDADACDEGIRRLRHENGWPAGLWFHFAELSDKKKELFFGAVVRFDFRYVVSTLDKRRMKDKRWCEKKRFCDEACRRLVEPLECPMRRVYASTMLPIQGRAYISDTDEIIYLQSMQKHLQLPKAGDGKSLIKKATAQRSRSSNLLQLADMVCGAIVSQQNRGRIEYRKMIRAKEEKVVIWP